MSAVKWTDEQKSAIDARGSSLLVSAAAGSGKTAVLVARLIKRIIEEKLDITDFLIITYTKAAAAELRKKIRDALHQKSVEFPKNKHIKRQLVLCGNARISTVHSFCMWVLKNYGENPELSGDFRILDEAEEELILKEVLNELIEEKYEEEDEGFLNLATYMNDGRADRNLFSSSLELYKKSRSQPYPEVWLQKAVSAYDTSSVKNISETVWGSRMLSVVKETILRSARMFSILIEDVDSDAEASAIYHDALVEAKSEVERCISDDWDTLYHNLQSFSLKTRPSSRKLTNKSFADKAKAVYETVRDDVGKKLADRCMLAESSVLLSEISLLFPVVESLAALATELSHRFGEEKHRRKVLDYSDLEHQAIKLLVKSYDESSDVLVPSEVGERVSKTFREILLDEFQDSNIIQDIIFRAVSDAEKNIVMVGDVKQSIYGFRLADPEIFMGKYKSFSRACDARGDEPRYITLSRNFRSRGEVLAAVNGVFSRVMTEKLGGVDYNEEHALVPRDGIPEREGMESEFCLVDFVRGEEKPAQAEARFTASKISELVNGGFRIHDKDGTFRPCRYSDFAILLRSTSSWAPAYEKALSKLGIPCVAPRKGGLLEKSEVSSIVSFLSVIDNPTADVPLLATLKSPMFTFGADDLCEIRRCSKGAVIHAMEKLSKGEGETAKKCAEFLKLLRTLRSLARGMSASALIWEIYNRTNALGVFGALSRGEERQKNLIEFYNAAESYEGLGYTGLYKFISYIVSLAENEKDIPVPTAYSADAVTVMTMHKSKGLEFPIVFVGGVVRSFNTDDIKAHVLVDSELGIGLKFRDEENAVECTTLMRESIKQRIVEQQKSEELRLLYVALTRAREKMFITASLDNARQKLSKLAASNPYSELDSENLAVRNDALLWFMLPLLRSVTGKSLFQYAELDGGDGERIDGLLAYAVKSEEISEAYASEEEPTKAEKTNVQEVREMIDFKYKNFEAAKTPSKLTATGMGKLLDEAVVVKRKKAPRPGFIMERELTPAERGTALHLAMQFVDFEKCRTEEGVASEILRLYEKKYLTKAQVEAVLPEKILEFACSPTGEEIRKAKKVMREFKFSVLLPADELLQNPLLSGEKVLMQGVMDMCYETERGITILDFKTDKVRPEGRTLEKYKAQLEVYRTAFFEMTGKRAERLILYLVSTGEAISVC